MNDEKTYLGKASLSVQETIKAWRLEYFKGKTRRAAAREVNVCYRTLDRMYKHYGLPSPKSKKGKEYVKSLSLLQGCTPDRVRMPEKAYTKKE